MRQLDLLENCIILLFRMNVGYSSSPSLMASEYSKYLIQKVEMPQVSCQLLMF